MEFYEKLFTIEMTQEYCVSPKVNYARINDVTLKYNDIRVATLRYYYSTQVQEDEMKTPTLYTFSADIDYLIEDLDLDKVAFMDEINDNLVRIVRTYCSNNEFIRREL